MTIGYRTTPAYGSSTSNNPSISKQAGTQAGDWIFIYLSGELAPPNAASCTGFSAVHVLSGSGADGTLLYRLADGTEGASFSVTYSAGGAAGWVIATVSGASATLDPSTPATPSSTANSAAVPVSGITLAHAGDRVLWFAGANPASGTITVSPPAGFTTDASGTGAIGACVAHSDSFAAGATGTQTGSASPSGWSSGVMVGLTPFAVVHTAQNSASATGSPSVTVTVPATTAGNCLIVGVVTTAATTCPAVSGITLGGSAGNFGQLATVGTGGGQAILTWWADPNCAGGQTAVAITTTGGSGTAFVMASVLEVSGMPATFGALLDQHSFNDHSSGSSSAWTSGASPSTGEAAELWVGLVGTFAGGTANTSVTGPSSPWTNLAAQNPGAVSLCGYQVTTATGTATYSGTFSGTDPYVAGVVTLNSTAPPSAPGLLMAFP